ADDDAEFDFPVGLDRILGDDHIVIGADDGAGGLHEQDRFLGNIGAGFGSMVGIVEANADELADIGDAGADALIGVQLGQAVEIGGADLGQALVGQRRAANVVDNACQITDRAVLGQDGGLFCALGANAKQFHGLGPYAVGEAIAS